jgi:hypothetical protein
MRKNLISILLAGTLLTITSCDKKVNSLPINDIKIKQDTQKVSLKKKESITSEELKYIRIIFDEVGKKDEEYLNENLSNTSIIHDEESLKNYLINKLKEKQHTPRTNNPPSSEDYSQINDLSINQNKTIYLMLNALKDSSFCNEIGKIIQEDIKNKYSEIGGIITFKEKNKIKLKPIESELSKLKDEENDGQYLLPSDEHFSKKIAYFHLHSSKYDEKEFAGPSTTDLFILEAQATFSNLTNEFIITSLEKGKFNVDYAGVDRKKDKNARAIDLGNYLYDALITK